MLFETLAQPKIFAILALSGFIAGFVFDISNYLVWLCNKNKVVQIVLDFVATLCVFALFFLTALVYDYGNVRFYHILSFLTAFFVQRLTLGKIIAKLLDWCYNNFIKLMQKILKRFQKKKKDEKHNKSSKQNA